MKTGIFQCQVLRRSRRREEESRVSGNCMIRVANNKYK